MHHRLPLTVNDNAQRLRCDSVYDDIKALGGLVGPS